MQNQTGSNIMTHEEEDDVSCAKCDSKPEDVLILTCDHNLCLPCAAQNLHSQQRLQQNTFQVSCKVIPKTNLIDCYLRIVSKCNSA